MKKPIAALLILTALMSPLACGRGSLDITPPIPPTPTGSTTATPIASPSLTASPTPSTTVCVQNMLCIAGYHWDSSVCNCVPNATGTPSIVWTAASTSPTPMGSMTATPSLTTSPSPTPTWTPTAGTCGIAGASPAESDNLLAGSLYQALKSNSGNIFFSPFSILTALSMAQEGANGDTACQMQTVLDLDPLAATRLPAFQSFLNTLNAPSMPYTLMTSDNLWVQQGFNLTTSYVNNMKNYYNAGVTNVDFVGNPTGALNTIDGAVSQQTGGYIPHLLSAGDINPYLKLILTNAVFFKGTWLTQFQTTMTYLQNFYLDNGTSESVSMMHASIPAPIGNFNGTASVLALPYKGSGASMYILLPPLGGTAALESALTPSNIQGWLASNGAAMTAAFSSQQVEVALPKFTFSTQYNLASTLPGMGMTLPFVAPSPGGLGADFSGIDGMTGNLRDLYIQFVVHQAYVGVDETGTTAAAATGVGMGATSVVMTPPPFIVDHPFIFLIVDNATGAVLFMGRVSNPLG